MNRKELQAYNVLLRQVSSERAERDTSALARSSLYRYEKREQERKSRRAARLQIVTSWLLFLAIVCVTMPIIIR
jgi:hypothetical protein